MANDITNSDHVRGLDPSAKGTGIYWFIDPQGGVQKMFTPRVTRELAGLIADDLDRPGGRQELDAYRWVPDRVEGADSLINTLCAGARCRSDTDCRDTACHCINNMCQ
jgi:hypothetical protein